MLVAAAIAVAALSPGARADGFRGAHSGLELPGVVVAGEQHTLAWTAPAGVIELELEISLDDGRSWSRLSPELHGAVQSWVWRVPSTPSDRARVRLRVGTEHGEYDLAPTDAFRIELPAGEALPPAWHPHAWRGRAALPGTFGRARERLWSGVDRLPADHPPRVETPAVAREELARLDGHDLAVLPVAPMTGGHAPRFVPLRN